MCTCASIQLPVPVFVFLFLSLALRPYEAEKCKDARTKPEKESEKNKSHLSTLLLFHFLNTPPSFTPPPHFFSPSSSSHALILLPHHLPLAPCSFWRGNSSGDRRSRNPFFSLNAKWLCSIIFSQKLTIFPLQPVKTLRQRAGLWLKRDVDFSRAEFELSTLCLHVAEKTL